MLKIITMKYEVSAKQKYEVVSKANNYVKFFYFKESHPKEIIFLLKSKEVFIDGWLQSNYERH